MRKLLVLAAVVAAGIGAALLAGSTASGRGGPLRAFVVVDNPGPLTPCAVSSCPVSSTVHWYVDVLNASLPTAYAAVPTPQRADVPGAYVVNSVDMTMSVNGVPTDNGVGGPTMTPPPSPQPGFWSGHWPVSVRCPAGSCTDFGKPAVLPGENVAVVFGGWAHGATEPKGTYVFSFVIHGTLDGAPVDLTASSQPILMP